MERLGQIVDEGKSIKANLHSKIEADQKAQAEFEEKREKDIQEVRDNYELLKQPAEVDNQKLVNRPPEINKLITKGNLSEEQYNDFVVCEMELQTLMSLQILIFD